MHGFTIPPDANNLTVALALAKAGLPVFPAKVTFNQKKGKWDKEPHIKGWQAEATTDEQKLMNWWREWPQAVPGIELGRAGLLMIDADRHGRQDGCANFAELVAQHKPLPAHPIAKTAGDGEHHYFRQWKGEVFGNSEGALRGREINVRGKGGWAVAPGSVRPDGKKWSPVGLTAAYHDNTIPLLPDWIAALIRPPREPVAPAKPTNGAATAPQANVTNLHKPDRPALSAAEVARVRDALALIPSEDRATWFEVGASLHWTGWPVARAIWDEWSQTTPGAFDADGQAKAWASFDRPYSGKPKTLASLFHLAQANGFQQKAPQPEPVPEPAPPEQQQTAPLIQSSAEFVKEFVPPDYLIDGILQRRFFYSLTGRTGSGKTAVVLLFAAHVALARTIGTREVTKGRVLYFAGENPDDVRMRWIAMAQHLDFDINTIEVSFIPGTFKISQLAGRIAQEVKEHGEVALVVIDTNAAFFEGDDENSNAQQGAHARRLRSLVKLPGGPCVLALCHPVKNAAQDNLIPRGGGAYVAEVDGNLTSAKEETAVEVHWQGKFRGPDFAPLTFVLRTVTHERLKDSKGRLIPTVIAAHLSETGQEELANVARSNEIKLLAELDRNGKASHAELARALGWSMKNGEPYKVMVRRTIETLAKHKLITVEHDGVTLTSKGNKALQKED